MGVYNRPSLYASIAWSLALLLSTPQLFLFYKDEETQECTAFYAQPWMVYNIIVITEQIDIITVYSICMCVQYSSMVTSLCTCWYILYFCMSSSMVFTSYSNNENEREVRLIFIIGLFHE